MQNHRNSHAGQPEKGGGETKARTEVVTGLGFPARDLEATAEAEIVEEVKVAAAGLTGRH